MQEKGVAFFLKQLGRNPTQDGRIVKFSDKHGGNWDESEPSLRIREFPEHFHRYRAKDRRDLPEPRRRIKSPKAE